MKRRTFLSALVGAGSVAAMTSYIARHLATPKKVWHGPDRNGTYTAMSSDLNQQSLERMLEALKTDFVDRGKTIVVRPTKILVLPEQYNQWCDAFG
jgi:hypothetical protein